MGKSLHFNNCIREIRQSVFGRDNRKPIADAIEEVKSMGYTAKEPTSASVVLIDQQNQSYRLVFSSD